MRRDRLSSRRMIALAGAITILAGLLAIPASAGAATPPSFQAGFSGEKRAPVATGRVNAREAARVAAASPRAAAAANAALARPDRFAGTKASTARQVEGDRRALLSVGPALVSTHEFTGIDQADAGGGEPPDPWVAVSSSHIVQSTNGVVRMSDRNGRELATIATWAMFSVYPGYLDADPRIIWDTYHGRWIGVLIWFDYPAFTDTYLTMIVSETSDPLGSWDSFTFPYDEYLPDYPAIASSSDKIVITANEFVGADFVGSSFLLMPWSQVLAGTDLSAYYAGSSSAWNLRPGRVHGTSADLHLVYESDFSGTLTYLRVKGSAGAPTLDEYDLGLTNGTGIGLDPRQPGDADGIDRADDGRIADAVWRGNQLWFTRTVGYAWNAVDPDMAIEVVRVDTSTTAAPSVGLDVILPGTSGVDMFTSGIGTSNGGTAFVTYSQSSAAQAPALVATAIHPSLGFQPAITLETSEASYGGSRWGDFAGIAADPSGTDAVWQTHEVSDISGNWRTVVSRLVLDPSAPTASAPNQALVAGTTLGQYKSYAQSVPVKVSWLGSDTGSGIAAFRLDVADHGYGFRTAVTTSATSTVRTHEWKPAGATYDTAYQYQVTPMDDGGNVGPTYMGSALTPTVYQQTSTAFTYSTGWGSSTSTSFSGGSAKYSSTAGKYVSFRTSGRSFGFVSTRATSRGKVKVYVDGAYKGTITLTSSTTKFRNLVYVVGYTTSATHTIKLVVASGRVDVDAFVVLR